MMDFIQTLFMLSLAFISLIILLIRLPKLLSYYLDAHYSSIVSYAILFHPLSIEAFLSLNFPFLSGALPFILFVEAMIFYKDNHFEKSIFLFIMASLFNFSYSFFPIFFFLYELKKLKKYFPYIAIYTIGLSLYLPAHLLKMPHNPLIFFTYFTQNVIFPFPVNIINFALFPLSQGVLLFNAVFIILFLFLIYKKKLPKELLIIIFLPSFSSAFFPWTKAYNIFHEFIISPSSYLPITFGIVLFIALNIPKKIFNFYFSYIFILSLFWIFNSFPYSSALKESMNNLPNNFIHETASLQKILSEQYAREGRIEQPKQLLNRNN